MKAGFKFTNRQAVSSCGCGSFKTAETAGAAGRA
jgi:hypothetical protein